jgi:pilus retraction protein PilT
MMQEILAQARELGYTDIFFRLGQAPQGRVQGKLHAFELPPSDSAFFDSLLSQLNGASSGADFDTGLILSDGSRVRVNLFQSLGLPSAVIRLCKSDIPDLDSLGIPTGVIERWLNRRAGLVLVSGPPGSGKSTTVACMLERLNQLSAAHVITVEDPVEYVFQNKLCLFSQREVGLDTPDFKTGMKQALRQSPDVIFLGEIRDVDTANTALQAAETGHLVLTTVHSSNAVEAVERVIRLFPFEQRDSATALLASSLCGAISQRLIPGADDRLYLAVEHFENQSLCRKHILKSEWKDLSDFIGRGDSLENRSLLQSLTELVSKGLVSQEEASHHVSNPQELNRALQGINSGIKRN